MDKFYIPGLICFGLFALMYVSDNIADAIKTYSDKRNKENKAHFLVVVYDLHKDGVLHTKHVEYELVSMFSAQERIEKLAAPITLEQASDYFDDGFEWVPAYEKYADWPNMI